jgi:hypothetical protein
MMMVVKNFENSYHASVVGVESNTSKHRTHCTAPQHSEIG